LVCFGNGRNLGSVCGAKPFKGKGSRTNQPTKVWSTRILPASVPPSPSVRAPLPHSVPVPLLPAEKQRAGRAGPSSTHLAPLVVSCLTRPRIRDTSGASAGSDSEDACVHRRRLGRSTWLRADPAPERRGVAAASTSPGRAADRGHRGRGRGEREDLPGHQSTAA